MASLAKEYDAPQIVGFDSTLHKWKEAVYYGPVRQQRLRDGCLGNVIAPKLPWILGV